IVAMTAHAMQEERDACLASGMNDHLSKPVDPETLYQAIARWCPLHLDASVQHADKVASFMAEFDAETGYEPEAVEQPAPLLHIPGFDVADGLLRTLGNQEFYLQLLARFRDGQRGAPELIRAAILASDFSSAEHLSHTLKGVAGMLGAKHIARQAATLETLLRRRELEAELLPLLDQLERDMQAAEAALAAVLPPSGEAAPVEAAAATPSAALLPVLHELAALLSQNDSDAIDLFRTSVALLRSGLGEQAARDIGAAAERYDFDTALHALQAGARAAGLDLALPA
ncbi:MAG TPA: Hpt domain-containing protein, partial [Burkholderiaceae bacterium]